MAFPDLAGDMPAKEVIRILRLERHPEGGWYRETYRSDAIAGGRPALSLIHFLLEAGDVSHWHRVDADESWHWHAGGPLVLTQSPDGVKASATTLGPSLRSGQRPHLVVPKGHWQAAESLGAWTLVSCTVAPAFSFEGFELAPAHWRPGSGHPGG